MPTALQPRRTGLASPIARRRATGKSRPRYGRVGPVALADVPARRDGRRGGPIRPLKEPPRGALVPPRAALARSRLAECPTPVSPIVATIGFVRPPRGLPPAITVWSAQPSPGPPANAVASRYLFRDPTKVPPPAAYRCGLRDVAPRVAACSSVLIAVSRAFSAASTRFCAAASSFSSWARRRCSASSAACARP